MPRTSYSEYPSPLVEYSRDLAQSAAALFRLTPEQASSACPARALPEFPVASCNPPRPMIGIRLRSASLTSANDPLSPSSAWQFLFLSLYTPPQTGLTH